MTGSRIIERVAPVVAHELGNSMTAMTFAADLLREGQRTVAQRRALDDLRTVIEQASALVRLFARLASAATPVVELDVRDVVAEAAPLLGLLAARELRIEAPDAAVPLVAARSELERALAELVLGARDAAGAAGLLQLRVERDGGGRIRIALEAASDGRRIAPERIALPCAQAFAEACSGTLRSERLANGALRLELTLASDAR